ncbi:DUF4880 domain-containing protein [Nonomuraea sp. NPDC003560]|uniref:DUF4880 domain-containing protein n=1 Tax=Nonomuraea sp. NPDC003560 TaxID=3364341 RepID=UPI0036AD86A5
MTSVRAKIPGPEAVALHTAIEERRHQLGLLRWQLAVQLDFSLEWINRLRHGEASQQLRQAVLAWLHRHPAPSPTAHETKQGGKDHDSGGNDG